ncbi:hypothetical protein BpHYR1_014942 [Brachionus plicatilis]|uniref:Uncharacterized protein n=1 Tax=Brachionus plicatilis TaxID=10195 RepID=A0A3M7PUG6_BRAPC|nr:hypothetical protein BpHYR1_014942 [Brachionus plicatilis]
MVPVPSISRISTALINQFYSPRVSDKSDSIEIAHLMKQKLNSNVVVLSITTTPTLFNLHVYSFTVQYHDLMCLDRSGHLLIKIIIRIECLLPLFTLVKATKCLQTLKKIQLFVISICLDSEKRSFRLYARNGPLYLYHLINKFKFFHLTPYHTII